MVGIYKLMQAGAAVLMAWALSACVPVGVAYPTEETPAAYVLPQPSGPDGRLSPEQAARNFVTVVSRVEPIAEQYCRAANPRANCDFLIFVDDRPNQPPNAYQTLARSGRPLIGFTLALIAEARNADEIAFVIGHESAHHIAGHIPQTQAKAQTGAILAGIMAQASGASPDQVRSAQQMGATMGARTYSRTFELEADALGAEIAYYAGYDPLRGAAFFDRLPDPGDRFLGTHPGNGQRKDTVRRVMASLR